MRFIFDFAALFISILSQNSIARSFLSDRHFRLVIMTEEWIVIASLDWCCDRGSPDVKATFYKRSLEIHNTSLARAHVTTRTKQTHNYA